MKKLFILLLLLISSVTAYAQTSTEETKTVYSSQTDYWQNYYYAASPEEIWSDYLTDIDDSSFIDDLEKLKEPYYTWGIREAIKRNFSPYYCGYFLSKEWFSVDLKNEIFNSCMVIYVNNKDLNSMVEGFNATYIPPDTKHPEHIELGKRYINKMIEKLIENYDYSLSNSDLTCLMISSSTENKLKIIPLLNFDDLDDNDVDRLTWLGIPYYSDFFKSIKEKRSETFIVSAAKHSVLSKIMK